jgi:iron(III) transport system permease protein
LRGFAAGVKESGPLRFLWTLCLAFLLLFILYPLLRVLSAADPESWRRALGSARLTAALSNTLVLVLLSTFFSVLIGFIYAYAVIRGGIPFSNFFAFIPVLHLVTPPFVGGLSFILLFGRQGFFTRTLLHLDLSLYGLPGLLVAQTLCFFPIAFLIIKDTLEGINPSLEYAARALGAGRLRVFGTVTAPLALPGIASALLFIAISVLGDFGNPMLIGGRYNVLAVELYTQLTGWANAGISAVLGIILLVPAFVFFVLQRLALRRRDSRFATVGSRSSSMPLPLPALPVRVLLFAFCAFITFIVAAQFLAMAGGAFSRIWGVDPGLTLNHLKDSLDYRRELLNTLAFSFSAACITTVLGTLISFLALRTDLSFRRLADLLVMIPAAIPGSLTGLAFVIAFNGRYFRLTGTRALIVLAIVVCNLPAAYRILASSVMGIRSSLDDGARALGASRLRLFLTVICPLVIKGVVSAFVFTFVRSTGTVSAVIFLIGFKTKIASVTILNLASQGDWGKAAALAFILTAITFLCLGILRAAGGRQFFRDMLERR